MSLDAKAWIKILLVVVPVFVLILFLAGEFGDSTKEDDSREKSQMATQRSADKPQRARRTRAKPTTRRTQRKPTYSPPTISDIAFEEVEMLFGVKSQRTTLQKKELWKDYEGKWVEWTGEVRSASSSWGSLTVSFRHQSSTWTSDVTVFFPKSAKNTLLQLTEGQWVTYQGKLDDYGEFLGHTLKEGRIIRVQAASLSIRPSPSISKLQERAFEIVDSRVTRDNGWIKIVGEVKNISSVPQGVELQAVARDVNGRVVAVEEFWPASINNIMPGQTYPFEHSLGELRGVQKVVLKVIDTRQW